MTTSFSLASIGGTRHAMPVVLVLLTAGVLPPPAVAQTTDCIHLNDRFTRCETMPDPPVAPPDSRLEERVKKHTDAIRRQLADVYFERAMQRLQAVVTATRESPPASRLTLQDKFQAVQWRELVARLPQVLFVSTVQEARDALDEGKRLMTSQARQEMGLDP